MDTRDLQTFLSAMRQLNFSRTAEELHMSVSAVSRSVQRLEEELDCTLFDRDRRGMRPTSAAGELARTAQSIASDWAALQSSVAAGSDLSGELRIYCSVTATHQLLSPLISAYRQAYPGVRIRLTTGDQADGVDRVASGDADVAVVARPESLAHHLSFRLLATSKMMFYAPRVDSEVSRALQGPEIDRISKAKSLPWILPERGVSRDLIQRWLGQRYGQQPEVYARVAGHEAIAAMVSLGLGVAVLPQLVVDASAAAAQVVSADPGDDIPTLAIGLCARTGRLRDPVVDALWKTAP